MRAILTALFDGIVLVLSQPAAAAIIASIVGIIGTLVVTRQSAAVAARNARLEYKRRRHDRFDEVLSELAAVADEWERAEVSLLLDYAEGVTDTSREKANALRQQVTNLYMRLLALAPHAEGTAAAKELDGALEAVMNARSNSYSTRTAIEGAIEEGRFINDPEMRDKAVAAPEAAYLLAIAIGDLFTANAQYVERAG